MGTLPVPTPRQPIARAEAVFLREQIARYRPQFDINGSLCILAIDAQARGMHALAQNYVFSARRIDDQYFGGYFSRTTQRLSRL